MSLRPRTRQLNRLLWSRSPQRTSSSYWGRREAKQQALTWERTYAYLGMGPRLLVLDVGDPADPHTVGETGILFGSVGIVRLSGQRILADIGRELGIIDVADPTHPSLISTLALQERQSIVDIEAVGDYAYVLTYDRLYIIAVADPLHPTLVGTYESPDDLLMFTSLARWPTSQQAAPV